MGDGLDRLRRLPTSILCRRILDLFAGPTRPGCLSDVPLRAVLVDGHLDHAAHPPLPVPDDAALPLGRARLLPLLPRPLANLALLPRRLARLLPPRRPLHLLGRPRHHTPLDRLLHSPVRLLPLPLRLRARGPGLVLLPSVEHAAVAARGRVGHKVLLPLCRAALWARRPLLPGRPLGRGRLRLGAARVGLRALLPRRPADAAAVPKGVGDARRAARGAGAGADQRARVAWARRVAAGP
mmetsp:Transcript_21084/g.67191  ORF Transcript_21084/g.67191 Transcript_21084/m.67191 type:complete len:239 (-) Transcript_21084:46-762(-)